MDIRETLRVEIAKLQAALDALEGKAGVAVQPARPNTRLVKRRVVSPETRAKMKAAQQARRARKLAAQSESGTTATESLPESPTVREKAKIKKSVVNPSATAAMQSILPPTNS